MPPKPATRVCTTHVRIVAVLAVENGDDATPRAEQADLAYPFCRLSIAQQTVAARFVVCALRTVDALYAQ